MEFVNNVYFSVKELIKMTDAGEPKKDTSGFYRSPTYNDERYAEYLYQDY
jgi:hypothetical protein